MITQLNQLCFHILGSLQPKRTQIDLISLHMTNLLPEKAAKLQQRQVSPNGVDGNLETSLL